MSETAAALNALGSLKDIIDMTKGRRVKIDAIVTLLKDKKNKELKIAMVKLMMEGVRLSDNRKVGTKTIKSILTEANVKLNAGKEVDEDALTISRITRVIAPILVGQKAPKDVLEKGKWPMADFHPDAGKFWVPVSAMWVREMWKNVEWRTTYLYCMACVDYSIVTSKKLSGDGISIVNRAMRLFGVTVNVNHESVESRDAYAKAVLGKIGSANPNWDEPNAVFTTPETAVACLAI